MADKYDKDSIQITIGGKKFPIKDYSDPFVYSMPEMKEGMSVSFNSTREVTDDDTAFYNWFMEVIPQPAEPYKFRSMPFAIGDTGFILEFINAYVESGKTIGDKFSCTVKHEGYDLWLKCPRSGGHIWDDDTKVMAAEVGVYLFLVTGSRGFLRDGHSDADEESAPGSDHPDE